MRVSERSENVQSVIIKFIKRWDKCLDWIIDLEHLKFHQNFSEASLPAVCARDSH